VSLPSLQLHHHPENYKNSFKLDEGDTSTELSVYNKHNSQNVLETKINERRECIIILVPNLKHTIFITIAPCHEMLNNICSGKMVIK